MLSVRPITDPRAWDDAVRAFDGHPLQLWAWGEVKSRHRWSAERVLVSDGDEPIGGAQILTRRMLVVGDAVRHLPRGPFWSDGAGEAVVDAVVQHCLTARRGFVLQIEPDVAELPLRARMRPSPVPILMAETLILDTSDGEDAFLARMHKKTRYYVRKAMKDPGLEFRLVREATELDEVLRVYRGTASRGDFGIHSDEYYRDIAREFGDDSLVMGAFVDGELAGFLWDVASGGTAMELYGGSTEVGQERFANYGLKLAMARELMNRGVTRYDLNGLLGDGVASFKRGFWSGHTDELAGSFDVPLSRLYAPFVQGLPLAKGAVRSATRFRQGLGTRLR